MIVEKIHLHPHALERMEERGAIKEEVIATIKDGEHFPAKFGARAFGGISLLMASGVAGIIESNRLKLMLSEKDLTG